jgi:ParB-like chromosome segregation protein Spo0J
MTYKKLSEIKPNPDNPRVIRDENFKKLVNSIKEFPEMLEVRPIVVNKDMIILGGNMRFRVEEGQKQAKVSSQDNFLAKNTKCV